MAFSEGDFVKIEYNMWRKADNRLLRTTDKKLAEEKEIYDKGERYRPQLVVIGKDRTLNSLSEALKGMGIGEAKKLELEPEDAFGARDPNLVKLMPLANFRKRDIEPRPGMQIDIDGMLAMVKSVNSGRVMIDANHPLAGERIVYEVRVVEKVEKNEDKIKALSEFYNLEPEGVELKEKVVEVKFGGKARRDEDYFMNKNRFAASILAYLGDVDSVVIEEEYTRSIDEKTAMQKN